MSGDQLTADQQRWVEAAAPYVTMMARKFAARLRHMSVDELRSAGYEGLVQAALRYDPAIGVPFRAFAHHRVRGAMLDACRRGAPRSRRHVRAIRALEATQALLEHAQRRLPPATAADQRSLKERVAAAGELVAQTTAAVLLARAVPIDPDQLVDPETGDVEDGIQRTQVRQAIDEALGACTEEERRLVQAIYYEGRSMHDYAKEIGKAVSTVSRSHAKVIKRLSRALRRKIGGGVGQPIS